MVLGVATSHAALASTRTAVASITAEARLPLTCRREAKRRSAVEGRLVRFWWANHRETLYRAG